MVTTEISQVPLSGVLALLQSAKLVHKDLPHQTAIIIMIAACGGTHNVYGMRSISHNSAARQSSNYGYS